MEAGNRWKLVVAVEENNPSNRTQLIDICVNFPVLVLKGLKNCFETTNKTKKKSICEG